MGVTVNKVPDQQAAEVLALVDARKKTAAAKRKPTHGPDHFGNALGWIARGLSIAEACRKPDTPSRAVFDRWRKADERNEEAFKEAQAAQTHDLVDSVFERIEKRLAKPSLPPAVILGYERMYKDHVQWVSARRNPNDYGAAAAGEVDRSVVVHHGLPPDTKGADDDAKDDN